MGACCSAPSTTYAVSYQSYGHHVVPNVTKLQEALAAVLMFIAKSFSPNVNDGFALATFSDNYQLHASGNGIKEALIALNDVVGSIRAAGDTRLYDSIRDAILDFRNTIGETNRQWMLIVLTGMHLPAEYNL